MQRIINIKVPDTGTFINFIVGGQMLEINSNQNPLIKEIKSLNRKKNRWANRLFIIEGIKIIEEAIINEIKIKNIIISDSFLNSQDGALFYEGIKSRDNLVKVSDILFM